MEDKKMKNYLKYKLLLIKEWIENIDDTGFILIIEIISLSVMNIFTLLLLLLKL